MSNPLDLVVKQLPAQDEMKEKSNSVLVSIVAGAHQFYRQLHSQNSSATVIEIIDGNAG